MNLNHLLFYTTLNYNCVLSQIGNILIAYTCQEVNIGNTNMCSEYSQDVIYSQGRNLINLIKCFTIMITEFYISETNTTCIYFNSFVGKIYFLLYQTQKILPELIIEFYK